MRAMRAAGFSGYQDLKLVDIPKPAVSDGRVLVRITRPGSRHWSTRFCRGDTHGRKHRWSWEERGPVWWRGGGGERGNRLSCRFTCDVYGAVRRLREWNLQ